ncbi:response regulator transcription factor [Thalassobacillus sp. CUG 92003]|uniref:response regulator transcription factor n=1 Tax=Thalassobacillus sp. CUG 92003 TaxID=2736641 RepID=UPI0015E7225B|nr:response regulator transcription factor [Thalassobacillus sp. CUG 92003]
MNTNVLIIEDDVNISNLIKLYLEREEYEVLQAYDGEVAKRIYLDYAPCLIILDLMLPSLSGESFCKWVKRDNSIEDPAIIIISAKTSIEQKINGLRIGADDYITKPFSPEEMVTHVEAVLRRTGHFCHKIAMEGLVVKPRKGEVILYGEHLQLTSYEFNLLYELMKHPDQIFTRDQLLEHIHPYNESEIFPRTIDAHIKNLRRKIEIDPRIPKRIITVRGMGYKFAAPKN